jgi:hypothetical protein
MWRRDFSAPNTTLGIAMGLKTACVASLAFLALVSDASSAEIGGRYRLAGTNLDGSKYLGTVDITISSDTNCHIVWHTGGQDLNGICMRGPETFVAAYGDQSGAGLVLYRIEADGTLNGVWTVANQRGVGTDVLTPERSDGTEIVKNADGSSEETKPDGTKITTNADGSSIETRRDGTEIVKNADGSVVQVNRDGSEVLLHK